MMKTLKKTSYLLAIFLLLLTNALHAQPRIKIIAGIIALDDGTLTPHEKRYTSLIDSLDQTLKKHPQDTTSLFYRALLYLRYNSLVANPDLSSVPATDKLLLAKKMSDRADSLKMQSFNLKVLRAQLCKELTYRYAPIDLWRYNATQIADRKKKYEYFKDVANNLYDELALIDKNNAYDYQRLKVK